MDQAFVPRALRVVVLLAASGTIVTGSKQVEALIAIGSSYEHFVPAWDGPVGICGRSYQQERDPALWQFLYDSIGANPGLEVRLIHGSTDAITITEVLGP